MSRGAYVLVTPVKDEAATIGRTIAAVVRQTAPPAEWVIVSDGSTDGTNEIVAAAAGRHGWIRLLALPARATRSFAAVVRNVEAGISALKTEEYEYLGLLDADVDFQDDYFDRVIGHFEEDPALGLGGGVAVDEGRPRDRLPRNWREVPGATQFFRRSCFERLGGLIAVPEGGWDGLTCAMARMNGFETKLFTDLIVDHLKPRNVSQGGTLRRVCQMGIRDYVLGYDPMFELLKCLARVTEPPVVVGALAFWAGYCAAALQRRPSVVPSPVIHYIRSEQRRRMAAAFQRIRTLTFRQPARTCNVE